MRFYTIRINNEDIPVVSVDGGITGYNINDLGIKCESIAEFIRTDSANKISAVKEAISDVKKELCIDIKSANIMAPIIKPDQDVICLGINYDEHAVEAGRYSKEAFGGERPYTIYFSKRVSYATATGESIPSYEGLVDSLDYEAELGVVLGEDVKGVDVIDAKKCVFGYTIINDVSARNIQKRHKQWYLGKSLDGFTPMGPCIVTEDELGDAENLAISCEINGELRQNSNTKYMIQKISNAIAELSEGMTLKAGTIIATGTPAGVGMGFEPPKFLKKGDVIKCIIEGIGELENTVD